ncbi:disease resistance protein RGA5-like isoform X2 [Panicum virgatum]|nr:disease resistance protein RGA5-like isoform X2 [Panicum virgatum]
MPRLSHLTVPHGTRLPDRIGKVKSLRTLHGFMLPMDSLEGIIGLGELTALSDLEFSFPNGGCTGLSKAAWMTALSTSLDKLGNLKQLRVNPFDVFKQVVALRADALSSLSPPFRNLELLDLKYGCTFSQVPRWIGHLHSLRELYIGAKRVLEEDVALIGTRLPSLIILSLRILGIPTERIVIGGSTGFLVLSWFWFDCDGMSFLAFEAGAMPALRELELVLDGHEWDKAAPAGLHHLLSLEKITTMRARYGGKRQRLTATGEDDTALIRSVFQEAADTLPTRPEFELSTSQKIRPMEEED